MINYTENPMDLQQTAYLTLCHDHILLETDGTVIFA